MFELLKNDKKSFIMLAISILLSIVGLVCYIASQNLMNAKINVWLIIIAVVSILLTIFVAIYKDFKSFIMIAISALTFLTLLLVVSSQLGNLGYYFAGIKDIGYGIMPTFVVSALTYIVSVVLTSIEVFKK